MAANADGTVKGSCKYCKSGVKNSVISCCVCSSQYHSSCAQRNCIIYCNSCKLPGDNQAKPELSEDSNIDFSLEAYRNLKLLVAEQALANKLLMEKVNYLQRKLSERETVRQQPAIVSKNKINVNKANSSIKQNTDLKDKKEKDKKHHDNKPGNTQGSKHLESSKEDNAKSLELHQQKIMNDIIDLGRDTAGFPSEAESDQDFQMVTYKRTRKYKRPNLGTSTSTHGNEKFEAVKPNNRENRKLWLFISRIKETVQEEDVRAYVAGKGNIALQKVDVKSLHTKSVRSNYKSFMVGVPTDLLDLVYGDEFWPSGVAFSRFDFRRGQHFLEDSSRRNEAFQEQVDAAQGIQQQV